MEFLLAYIKNSKGFHCDNSVFVYSALWANSLPIMFP
jgi:hypothetical protein